MKYLLSLTISILFSGCMYQDTSSGDLQIATKACALHGGIHTIRVYSTGYESAICIDGTETRFLDTIRKNKK